MIIVSCIILPPQFFRFDLDEYQDKVNMLLRAFNILTCLVIMEMEVEMMQATEERDIRDRLQWMLEQKREQYENAKATAEMIRVRYHDIKHFLNSESGPQMIGDSLAQDLREDLKRYDVQYNTGCNALDIVLTEKAARCIRESVVFSCVADGASLRFMRSVDIYTLFSNALDNAIEAVIPCALEKRIISLSLRPDAGMICLHLENYCEQAMEWRGDELVSSKQEGDWHGYGTKSIRMIVEKYGGVLRLHQEDSIFSLDAVFFPQTK